MEVLFENVYEETEDMVYRLNCKVLHKQRILWTVLMSFFAAAFAFLGWILERIPYLLAAVAYLLLAVRYFRMPRRYARKALKKKLEYYNGTNPPMTVQFGEEIVFRDLDSLQTIPYSKVKNLYMLKGYLCIRTEMNAWHAFPMTGFTKGSPRELTDFLREKCPQLKLPDWQW